MRSTYHKSFFFKSFENHYYKWKLPYFCHMCLIIWNNGPISLSKKEKLCSDRLGKSYICCPWERLWSHKMLFNFDKTNFYPRYLQYLITENYSILKRSFLPPFLLGRENLSLVSILWDCFNHLMHLITSQTFSWTLEWECHNFAFQNWWVTGHVMMFKIRAFFCNFWWPISRLYNRNFDALTAGAYQKKFQNSPYVKILKIEQRMP